MVKVHVETSDDTYKLALVIRILTVNDIFYRERTT